MLYDATYFETHAKPTLSLNTSFALRTARYANYTTNKLPASSLIQFRYIIIDMTGACTHLATTLLNVIDNESLNK